MTIYSLDSKVEMDEPRVKSQREKQISYINDLGSIPGLEDLLEKGMATHSSVLAWEISWTEEPDGLQSRGSQKVGRN